MKISPLIKTVCLLLLYMLLVGCATTATPDLSAADPARRLDSLSSAITVSFKNSEKSLSGRGFMLFKRPDQMRMILLSPFGTTMMEAALQGDQLLLAYPADGALYQGMVRDLPKGSGQQGFAMLQWVLDMTPPEDAPDAGVVDRAGRGAAREQLTLAGGLVVEKHLSSGEMVQYRNYKLFDGVVVPQELIMESAEGDRIRITLLDPEINLPLEADMFTVSQQGLHLLPLKALQIK